MPTYDYECTSCNKVIEVFQQMSEAPLQKCPECGKKIKRLVGGGLGVIFKGSGFYVTDSKKSNSGSSAKSGKGNTSETAPSSESKPEGKSPASESCNKCSAPACPATNNK
ncbi:MAG: zinc ribbon domain-containing protein [Spirochaetaceae bacterium]|nr:zinc ribbon domain-containing protein [Spirochaetaceae bacterium]